MDKSLRDNLFQALLVHAGADGRDSALFGDSYQRARQATNPFLVGEEMPSVYLEFPLLGDPFLDLTFLYSSVAPGTHVDHPAAAGTQDLFDWFAAAKKDHDSISFGFELDTKEPEIPTAAIHFQPRTHTSLVQPFCQVMGEPERADLYMDMDKRMPEGWPLSFFGMFRGRPGSPLRVCGYLGQQEQAACAQDPHRIQKVFDSAGFSAYDATMLEQISALFAITPGQADFQLDIYPDGKLGDTFAIDVGFDIAQPEQVLASFTDGAASKVMRLFQNWGIADERVGLVPDLTFARGLPVPNDDGTTVKCLLTLFPMWAKVRWCAGVLQPAKLYAFAKVTME